MFEIYGRIYAWNCLQFGFAGQILPHGLTQLFRVSAEVKRKYVLVIHDTADH